MGGGGRWEVEGGGRKWKTSVSAGGGGSGGGDSGHTNTCSTSPYRAAQSFILPRHHTTLQYMT